MRSSLRKGLRMVCGTRLHRRLSERAQRMESPLNAHTLLDWRRVEAHVLLVATGCETSWRRFALVMREAGLFLPASATSPASDEALVAADPSVVDSSSDGKAMSSEEPSSKAKPRAEQLPTNSFLQTPGCLTELLSAQTRSARRSPRLAYQSYSSSDSEPSPTVDLYH